MPFKRLVLVLALPTAAFALPDSPQPKLPPTASALCCLTPHVGGHSIQIPQLYEPYWTREMRRLRDVEAGAMVADTVLTCRNLAQPHGREFALPVHTCAQMVWFQAGEHLAAYGLSRVLWHYTHSHAVAAAPMLWMIGANGRGAVYSARHP